MSCQDGTQAAVPFRYDIKPRAKINSFKPKTIGDSGDNMMELRSGVLGACFAGSFKLLQPSCATAANQLAQIVWEVPWQRASASNAI